jgi:predicted AlkP superfamily pyrophosphatase or phosphodiesterase
MSTSTLAGARRLSLPLALGLVLAAASLAAADPAGVVMPGPRLVLVSIDGLSPASYREPDALGLSIPNLRDLVRTGASASGVQGVLPTVTYPSHTTLLTGVPPRIHGILGNRIFDPEGRSNQAWHWYADEIRVPTLATAAYGKGLLVGSVFWPVTLGLEVDALVPEFWRSGSSHPADLELLRALSSQGLVDEVEATLGHPLAYPLTDAERTELALHVLRTRKPNLLLLHLIDHDFAQHEFGIGSPEALAALERIDAELGRIRATLGELGLAERTLFVIVSDHGFLPGDRELHPNALLRQAGLLETDKEGKIARWRAAFEAEGGSALLRLADPTDGETLLAVRALFEKKLQEKGSGLRAVLGAPEIAALGGDPEIHPLALDAREGFCFGNVATGGWSVAAKDRAHHGYAPVRPELEAALIVAGPGLARTGDLGTVPMTRIAPTLARYLGVELDPRADAPMDWLLPASP